MPRKVLEGCQWGSAVPRTVLAPLTGPQIKSLGIYFRGALFDKKAAKIAVSIEKGDHENALTNTYLPIKV
jgi:hypothetical protein